MQIQKSRLNACFFVAAGIVSILFVSVQTLAASEASRTIVLGEVQCAFNTTTNLLQDIGLIDENLHWTGGETTLIQTGDLIDGGESARQTMDLFMRLQDEAEAAGGKVVVLLGNHEIMNIVREFRSVNYMAYATFAGPDSETRQQRLFQEFVEWRQHRAKETRTNPFNPSSDFEADFLAVHPPGWAEYAEAMGPDGTYGRWLRSLPVAYQLGDVLFIHGGISPELKGLNADAINRRAAEEIAAFDEDSKLMVKEGLCLPYHSVRDMAKIVSGEVEYVGSLEGRRATKKNPRAARLVEVQELTKIATWTVLDDDGPMWFSGAADWSEVERGAEMQSILDAAGIERMVTGQSGGNEKRIQARFNDRVVLTSVNLADGAYSGGGTPAALEIRGGVYTVVTSKGSSVLLDQ